MRLVDKYCSVNYVPSLSGIKNESPSEFTNTGIPKSANSELKHLITVSVVISVQGKANGNLEN